MNCKCVRFKIVFRMFLVVFGFVTGSFSLGSCSGSKLVWSTSNGIVTYNRHTGQFEMLWEANYQQHETKIDTVFICPEDSTMWVKRRN